MTSFSGERARWAEEVSAVDGGLPSAEEARENYASRWKSLHLDSKLLINRVSRIRELRATGTTVTYTVADKPFGPPRNSPHRLHHFSVC